MESNYYSDQDGIFGSRGAPAATNNKEEPFVHFKIETAPSWISVASSWILPVSFPNVILTSANHSIIHSHQSSKIKTAPPTSEEEEPDFWFWRLLLKLLLLSTALACCSAFDANLNCRSIEAGELYEQLTDDDDKDKAADDAIQEGDDSTQLVCKQMVYYVVIPVGVTIVMGGLLSLWWLQRHLRYIRTQQMDRLTRHTRHYITCLQVGLLVAILLLACTYGTVAIMLRPRVDNTTSNTNNDSPYQSLAAVDYMGHVSDNANLYYTCWISLGLVLALQYQIVGDAVRQYRLRRRERLQGAEILGENVEAMLSSLTVYQLEQYRESRAMWYQSLYKLRIRTGIWTATCLATLLVMASSIHIWREVLIPTAKQYDADVSYRDVCSTILNEQSSLPPTLCARTLFSLGSGLVASCLSLGAIVTHLLARRGAAHVVDQGNTEQHACAQSLAFAHHNDEEHEIPTTSSFGNGTTSLCFSLQSEFLLAVLLSNLLGLNAVFATGVHGPAAAVGNLYYASWISFLLCLRICLGCLEELCHIEEEEDHSNKKNATYDPPSIAGSESTRHSRFSVDLSTSLNITDLNSNERAQRTRKYLFLGIFSTVCSASAFDAAMNQQQELAMEQEFVILAPSLVAVVCACQFLLCLRTETYRIVSQPWFGGLLSMLIFAICFVTLVITMHSESSWAVNAIGEIQMANLYYFTWASIITAGLQSMSYTATFFGVKTKPYLTVVWAAVCKVCFVILGGGFHIWHNIGSACTIVNNDDSGAAVTFCSRTILAIVVALTGMLVSGLVAFFRILFTAWWADSMLRTRTHVELVMSIFLVFLFGAAVALVTGIGGPGQSVGDLFYGTWLAFLVSIGLVVACLEEIRRVDAEDAEQQQQAGVSPSSGALGGGTP